MTTDYTRIRSLAGIVQSGPSPADSPKCPEAGRTAVPLRPGIAHAGVRSVALFPRNRTLPY